MTFGRTGRAAWRGLCQASGVLVLAIACVVSAAAWVYLVAGHGGFWLTSQRLPAASGRLADGQAGAGTGAVSWPAVAAVVPARNEAESLPVTLPALLAQDYPGEFRVFLVDDNSDDGTGARSRPSSARRRPARAARR